MDAGAIRDYCATMLTDIDRLHGEVTAANVLALGDHIDDALGNLASTYSFLSQVHPDAATREAASQCYRDASAKASQLALSATLYAAFDAVDTDSLPCPEDKRYVVQSLRAFRRNGVSQPPMVQQELQMLEANITSLGEAYEDNVINDVRSVTVNTNTEPGKLSGLPADFVASHTDAAGVFTATTDYPDYFPVMKYADSADLRREMSTAFLNRGHPANLAVLDELLQKRYRYATLLGYDNWAAYREEPLMAHTPDAVSVFLAEVADLSKARAEAEEAQVLTVKKRDDPAATTLEAFDASYYMDKARDEFYGVNSAQVREYFTYANARDGVLALAASLFHLRFVSLPDADKWSPDVEVLDVYSLDPDVSNTGLPPAATAASAEARADGSGGTLVGRIYLDMHPRAGKYKHAASFPMVNGLRGRALTQTALACNFPATGAMEHSQVTTFLHEFGHLLHQVIGGVGQNYAVFSGVATEWDWVEAPSQMLEEWAWRPDVLASFAKNAQGVPIPPDLVAKMVNAHEFGVGMGTRQQVFYARVSLDYYNRNPEGLDTTAELIALQGQLSPYPYVPGTHFNCNFGHLVGYSSAYYTYQWSLAAAKDMYSKFAAAIGDAAASDAVAAAYSHKVLNPGGREDAATLMHNFLGRPYNLDAYKAYLSGADAPPAGGSHSGSTDDDGINNDDVQ
uniref:Peptidase M3A/M3B catalytic domain-containing protein n=1 Tax=Bicosoecida sp. CB-2014 TaxID=1486930 RepID=A0A7S1G8U4_9STRA|mmetsp:Transcript_24996/g.87121  ORF Transcript_24996/g.87121 Transcript_24996/m.87121 type:complete len:682 (+) Transcript_24996:263-2308(+)